MPNHENLHVWQRAHRLTVLLHRAFPPRLAQVSPGLRSQLLRSVASIPANIAEGAGHQSPAQFARFLTIAIGSASETENHLTLALELALLTRADLDYLDELRQIRRMLWSLQQTVSRRPEPTASRDT